MSLAEELAEYVHSISYADLNDETIHSAKRVMVDVLGCAIGANKEKPSEIVKKSIDYTYRRRAYSASVLGTEKKAFPPEAAFVNGTMARYFDYNDTYDGKEFSHPSDNILPILAVAEAERKTGKDALLAIVIAYEIQCRLADAANLWQKGWDHVTYGLVSMSAAVSKLMGISVEQTTQAINLALNSHLTMRQLRVGELSMWKAAAFANSARNAIFSVILAKNGMTGPAPVFEGEDGFWRLVTGKFTLDTKKFGNKRNKFKINETLIKYFPAETRAQSAIWCALDLKKKIKSLDDIKSIEIGTNEGGLRIIGSGKEKWNPKTKETADHSLPYIVAVALMDGVVKIKSYRPNRFRDGKTLALMKKIEVVEKKKFTKMFEKGGTVNADDVTIRLNSGKTLSKEVIYSRGHPKNPMSDMEIEAKFMELAMPYLNDYRMGGLLHMLWNFQKVKDVSSVFRMMRFDG